MERKTLKPQLKKPVNIYEPDSFIWNKARSLCCGGGLGLGKPVVIGEPSLHGMFFDVTLTQRKDGKWITLTPNEKRGGAFVQCKQFSRSKKVETNDGKKLNF